MFRVRSLFFSHFDVLKIHQNLKINIYYYDGQSESIYADLWHEFKIKLKKKKQNRNFEKTKNISIYKKPIKAMIIFQLIFKHILCFQFIDMKKRGKWMESILNKKDKKIIQKWKSIPRSLQIQLKKKINKKQNIANNNIFNIISQENTNNLKYIVLNHVLKNQLHCDALISMYLFFFLYFFNKTLYKKSGTYITHKPLETILKRFYMFCAGFEWMYRFFFFINSILHIILYMLNKKFIYIINFYNISNDCVNAKFLSRFIAKKFKKNSKFFSVINPIRKELLLVTKYTKGSITGIFYKTLNKKINYGKSIIYRKSIFKSFLIYLFIIYNKYSFKFYYKYFTLFSLNMLSVYIWFNDFFKEKKNLIKFSIKYIIRRSAFSYFFHYQQQSENQIKLFNKIFHINDKDQQIKFLPKINFLGFCNFIYEDFLINNKLFVTQKHILYKNMKYFQYTQYFFNKYMQYSFWIYNNSFYNLGWKYNNLKKRSINLKRCLNSTRGLLGFKIKCSGRFSRRQRAKSVWFSSGAVPLNTFNQKIDYSFFSIPITNSKITIKVWLFTSKFYINWYYKMF
jgi:hypothetical protein